MKTIKRFFRKLFINAELRDLEIQLTFFEISFKNYEKEKNRLNESLENL